VTVFDDAVAAAEQARTTALGLADQLAASNARVVALESDVAVAQTEIARLQAELAECGEEPMTGVVVPPNATHTQVNTLFAAAPEGETFRFSGTYQFAGLLKPKPRQKLVGPAVFDFGRRVAAGFNLRVLKIPGVEFEDLEMRSAKEWAIQVDVGTRIRRCKFFDCGWNGVRGNFDNVAANVLIEDCEFSGNGWDPLGLGHGCGGMKFFNTGGQAPGTGVTVRRTKASNNTGNGIWFDHECRGDLIEDCEASNNTRKGVFYEVSTGPFLLQRTTMQNNGQPGFQTTNTPRGEVRDNVFGGNGVAVAITVVDRTDHGAPFEDWKVIGNDLNGDTIRTNTAPGIVTIEGNTQ
jgi:uncharacterized small protein (DUF1192 family)